MVNSNAQARDDSSLNIVDKHSCTLWVRLDALGNWTFVVQSNENSSIML
jgi:hypothetical protein